MLVKTRIAPSPTGMIHIGNIRTAIWNYLFAKKHNGQFILRIDDTDVVRSQQSFVLEIKKALRFLNIEYDDEFRQSDRTERYAEMVQYLLDHDLAYKCFLSDQELQEMKDYNMNNKVKKYSKWRDIKSSDIAKYNVDLNKYVVRLRIVDEEYKIDDLVQGAVVFKGSQVDEFIIAKQDGRATYQLASVVDDIDTGITHIIRGVDHLTNTPKTLALYKAFAAAIPKFAHIPLVHDADGKKMSKRNMDASFSHCYAEYLPEAIFSYLVVLGSGINHGSDNEFVVDYSKFDLSKVGLSAVCFDRAKLNFFNRYYIKEHKNLVAVLYENNILDGMDISDKEMKDMNTIIDLIKNRCVMLSDFRMYIPMYLAATVYDSYLYVHDVVLQNWNEIMQTILDNADDKDKLFQCLKELATGYRLQVKHVMEGLRIIVAGSMESPNVLEMIVYIGVDVFKQRVKNWRALSTYI